MQMSDIVFIKCLAVLFIVYSSNRLVLVCWSSVFYKKISVCCNIFVGKDHEGNQSNHEEKYVKTPESDIRRWLEQWKLHRLNKFHMKIKKCERRRNRMFRRNYNGKWVIQLSVRDDHQNGICAVARKRKPLRLKFFYYGEHIHFQQHSLGYVYVCDNTLYVSTNELLAVCPIQRNLFICVTLFESIYKHTQSSCSLPHPPARKPNSVMLSFVKSDFYLYFRYRNTIIRQTFFYLLIFYFVFNLFLYNLQRLTFIIGEIYLRYKRPNPRNCVDTGETNSTATMNF